MSDKSAISWTDATWSPILGCSKVSSGCANCYAVRTVHRLAGNPHPAIGPAYAGLTARHANGRLDWTGEVRLIPSRLDLPLRWKAPRRVFVNSQSDLFHEALSDADIHAVFHVMALCPRHVFQVLTKRPARMRDYCRTYRAGVDVLPNVWLGTSVEHQAAADERIPHLLATPAAVRFLSCEPLLGPVDLRRWLSLLGDNTRVWEAGWAPGLHWTITGGESGPGYRPADPAWFGSIRDQCLAAGISYYHKQGAGARPGMHRELDGRIWEEYPA